MGILSGLFRSRDAPKDSTAGSAYRFFMGGSSSGKQVNERSAMQMTAVYSCVRILSEAVAGLPLHLYRYTDGESKEKAIDHPLYFVLHDEPNPEMTSFVFRETLMTHLLLWGNAYAQIIRNGKGEVIALYPLMPNRMTVDRDNKGQLYYEYQTSNDEAKTTKGGTVRLKPSDVLHVPGLGFDGLVGYSPIAMAKNAIGLAIAAEEYGSKFYANGAAPSGVLEHPGTLKDPSKVRDSWTQTFGGSGNATARQNGWMSANDIRELENLDRIPAEDGGDLYLINGNMTKLADAGIFAASGKENNSNEEVLELEESNGDESGNTDGNNGTDSISERHHRRGKLV